jgi:Fic family protein
VSSEVLAEAEDAAVAIARFDATLGGEIAPFSAVLLRSEAAASSQIEHLTASARAIAEAELGASNKRNASLVVANERAMTAALGLAARIDENNLLAMHDALLARHDEDISGHWREEQNWIGGSGAGPHEATFVPPHHERLPELIRDLLRFIDRNDIPVLAHAALAHAQFETLHPFVDGNGRTGRALVHAMLRNKGLTRTVTAPVSAGLLGNTEAYFEALTDYRDGRPDAIVRQLSQATAIAIANGTALVRELRSVREGWHDVVRARRDSATWRVADLLLQRPVVNAALVSDALGIRPGNVHRSIAPLEEAGVLKEYSDRARNRVWRADEVLRALDGFAARAGRRVPA